MIKFTSPEFLQGTHVILGIGAAIVAIVRYAINDGGLDPTYALFASALLGLSIANDYFNSPPKAP